MPDAAVSVKIDHVLFAVPDLEDAAARFDSEYGLTSLRGGQHPDHGTANMIIPLGSEYIELIAVVDPSEAAASPFGARVSAAVDEGGGWIGYALRVSNLAHHLDVGESTIDMSRQRPDGTNLSWSIGRFECLPRTGPPSLSHPMARSILLSFRGPKRAATKLR